ncbi:MAG: L-fucose:H+ symporter permease [Flavobacteriaceae bacterium]
MAKTPLITRDILLPFVLVTSLFALWGLANDITNPMVSAFKKVLELSNTQASWVQAAFYGGYFTMSLPAAYVLQRYTYKTGILIGLGLYAAGALLFYPAAAMESYLFFLTALYVLTFGLAFLETTANPLVLSLGPAETATQRLNFSQAFNPVGALTGLFIAQTFILKSLQSDDLDTSGNSIYETLEPSAKAAVRSADLEAIRNPYVIIGLVILVILIVMAKTKIPEQQQTSNEPTRMGASLRRLLKKEQCYGGFIAQLFYVGAQIMCWTYIYQYAERLNISNAAAVNYAYAALVLFMLGRFLFTSLMRRINERHLLLVLSFAAATFTLGTIFLPGMLGLYALVLVSFCMSIMFPTIYGITLNQLGEDAKTASALLVMAIVGGALMPVLQGLVLDLGGPGYNDTLILGVSEVQFSFVIPLLCFAVVGLYAYRSVKNPTFSS